MINIGDGHSLPSHRWPLKTRHFSPVDVFVGAVVLSLTALPAQSPSSKLSRDIFPVPLFWHLSHATLIFSIVLCMKALFLNEVSFWIMKLLVLFISQPHGIILSAQQLHFWRDSFIIQLEKAPWSGVVSRHTALSFRTLRNSRLTPVPVAVLIQWVTFRVS